MTPLNYPFDLLALSWMVSKWREPVKLSLLDLCVDEKLTFGTMTSFTNLNSVCLSYVQRVI